VEGRMGGVVAYCRVAGWVKEREVMAGTLCMNLVPLNCVLEMRKKVNITVIHHAKFFPSKTAGSCVLRD
jgi:hypothetical protein